MSTTSKRIVRSVAYLVPHSGWHHVLSCGLADGWWPKNDQHVFYDLGKLISANLEERMDTVSPHSDGHRGAYLKPAESLAAGWMLARQGKIMMLMHQQGRSHDHW